MVTTLSALIATMSLRWAICMMCSVSLLVPLAGPSFAPRKLRMPPLKSFSTWNCWNTTDVDGPEFDPFGVTVGGQFIQLTDNTGNVSQSGAYAVCTPANETFSFCFAQRSEDSTLGPATAVVNNFKVGDGKSNLVCISRDDLFLVQ